MPPDNRRDPAIEEMRPSAPVFLVAPVRERRRGPRLALVGLVVGAIAFVAGIGVASAGPAPRSEPATPRPAASEAAGPGSAATEPDLATPVPSGALPVPRPSLAAPGTSAFLTTFNPPAIVAGLRGADRCTSGASLDKEVPRTRRDGPRITFQRSWLIWCPVPAAQRQAFLLDTFDGLVDAIPADAYGFSAGRAGSGDALFPYAELPLAGTVAVTAGSAGKGLAIAIVVEEWQLEQDR